MVSGPEDHGPITAYDYAAVVFKAIEIWKKHYIGKVEEVCVAYQKAFSSRFDNVPCDIFLVANESIDGGEALIFADAAGRLYCGVYAKGDASWCWQAIETVGRLADVIQKYFPLPAGSDKDDVLYQRTILDSLTHRMWEYYKVWFEVEKLNTFVHAYNNRTVN
ncbi:hypothetical protein FACS189431_7650 [Alphaproteobacteria bacterium]|nr:hypothetical protein FACS189431_7650 [Alphaproteobacteria bacterium]